MKCPICQHEAYIGFNAIECSNSACEHYKAPRRNLGDVRDGDEELKIVAAPATPGWNHWLSSAKKTPQQVYDETKRERDFTALFQRPLTLKPCLPKCRHVGFDPAKGADESHAVAMDVSGERPRVVCTSESKRRVPQTWIEEVLPPSQGDEVKFQKICHGRTEICRWTMQNSPEGDKCRYIGWIDEHGNRNVALDDAWCKTQRQRWVIQPPFGQMEFGFKNVGEPFELSPAMKTVPGSDKVEDHFVIPETMTAKVVPSCFEAMWQIAKPIQNCDEGSHLIGHYEKYKGA